MNLPLPHKAISRSEANSLCSSDPTLSILHIHRPEGGISFLARLDLNAAEISGSVAFLDPEFIAIITEDHHPQETS